MIRGWTIAFLIFSVSFSSAQKLQFGVKGTLAGTVVFPAEGYNSREFKELPGLTGGIGGTGHFYLGKKFRFNITTGLQLQVKSYSFRLYDLNVSNASGLVAYRPLFISPEAPLLFCIEKKRKRKDDKYVNFQVGAVFSYNIPYMILARQKGPFLLDAENDTLISAFDVTSDHLKVFSTDIYAGISWVKKKKKRRITEWGISAQYALKNSASYHFSGYVFTAKDRKEYNADFENKLSYIAVHFIYYPQWWVAL